MIDDTELSIVDNPKSTLQELVQVEHATPVYNIINETGPAHEKEFEAEVVVDGEVLATGKGSSKKEAEVKAALNALQA
ncbi:MAG: putative dsRNA-binding protein [Coriobacteriia bacterium]|nr:putative dsRNA-binding protein [Coriobacteriia bacterium]